MLEIIKLGSIGYISSKAMKTFNKDYANIMQFVVMLYIGISLCMKIGGWYSNIMNCELIQLLQKIF
ncbi:hypothetical protein AB2T90_17055 [Clostridium butyricum]|uniref:hypothetical protein n=1 Tax=Clostridium butyricum TaxID=1492 RepID=UPI003466D1EA